jgi:crotonobetainyl-CoA:carnitine CoA-transferase CaiB-like acyl-CoA transferase
MALLDSPVAMLANQGMNHLATGVAPRRLGNAHPNIVPYQVFAASDGHLIVTVGNENQYRRLCEVVGRSELATDQRFASNEMGVKHRAEMGHLLGEAFRTRSMRDWLDALERAGVHAGRSTRSTRCLPIRKCGRAGCDSTWRIRRLALCRL